MKNLVRFTFACSLLALICTSATAESEKPERQTAGAKKTSAKVDNTADLCGCCGPGKTVSPLIMALDIDKDGVISELEIRNAASSLKVLDNDGDGHLSKKEFHVEAQQTQRKNDGKLRYQTGHTRRLFARKMLHKYDQSGDSALSEQEMPEALRRIQHLVDADGNGVISFFELLFLDRSIGD